MGVVVFPDTGDTDLIGIALQLKFMDQVAEITVQPAAAKFDKRQVIAVGHLIIKRLSPVFSDQGVTPFTHLRGGFE